MLHAKLTPGEHIQTEVSSTDVITQKQDQAANDVHLSELGVPDDNCTATELRSADS